MHRSIAGNQISPYQILAAISAQHSTAQDFESTDWNGILSLYDNLAQIDNSPIVLLNRAIAVANVKGPGQALAELDLLKDNLLLKDYHLFYSTCAEFYIRLQQFSSALTCLEKAFALAGQEAEKKLLRGKIEFCKGKAG